MCELVASITLYMALEGDSHASCMTECKQMAACFLKLVACHSHLLLKITLILNEPLVNPGQPASD